jgi:transcriptional regulator with XRE-family HTH domain
MAKPGKTTAPKPAQTEAEWAQYGRKFRRIREENAVSLRSVARSAGVSPGVVSKFERGEVSPTFVTVHRLLEVLGLSMAEFFGAVRAHSTARAARVYSSKGVKTASSGGEQWTWLLPVGPNLACQVFHEEWEAGVTRELAETLSSDLVGYILEGELTIFVPPTTGSRWRSMVARQGDVFYIPAGVPHRSANRTASKTRFVDLVLGPGRAAF